MCPSPPRASPAVETKLTGAGPLLGVDAAAPAPVPARRGPLPRRTASTAAAARPAPRRQRRATAAVIGGGAGAVAGGMVVVFAVMMIMTAAASVVVVVDGMMTVAMTVVGVTVVVTVTVRRCALTLDGQRKNCLQPVSQRPQAKRPQAKSKRGRVWLSSSAVGKTKNAFCIDMRKPIYLYTRGVV